MIDTLSQGLAIPEHEALVQQLQRQRDEMR
jgi:hypothetical protein